jgi:quercetin dioxygenase-like cupin family protein
MLRGRWPLPAGPNGTQRNEADAGGAAYRGRMNATTHTVYADLAAEATAPARGILSQTLSDADGVELVLFAMAAGERLSEHTSARPAIIHVLSGTGELGVAGETYDARPGAWMRMAARTPHSLVAETPLVFALYLLPV